MKQMKQIIYNFLFGPQVYKFYKFENNESQVYEANGAEKYASIVLKLMSLSYNLSKWLSPVILIFLFKKEMFNTEGMLYIGRYTSYFGLLWLSALITRGFGRFLNEDYRYIINILNEINIGSKNSLNKLKNCDISFDHWPIEYACKSPAPIKYEIVKEKYSLPLKFLAYVCVEIFGRKLLYPGSISLIQNLMKNALINGREKLVTNKNGCRYKIQTFSGNYIDSMFVDRRLNEQDDKASKLVICCEGNAGFYEIGCMETPLGAGYSVLGWNHPGFAGSSGSPTLLQEHEGIDAIIQFAINELNFPLEKIIIFAWSIGGYTASYAAMSYPDIKSVILDATFDNIEMLACERMPPSWNRIVMAATSLYLNLNNDELLTRYHGPILFIRRCKDEIISNRGNISTNRGNFFLESVLQFRYPNLFDEDTTPLFKYWISLSKEQQANHYYIHTMDESQCIDMLKNHSISYPSDIGSNFSHEQKIYLIFYLAKKYLYHFDATHCQPLPSNLFHEPWNPQL